MTRGGPSVWRARATSALVVGLMAASARGDESKPVEPPPPPLSQARAYGVDSGRFFLIAEPGPDGVRLARLAEEAWTAWSGPLALPTRWVSAITVRLTPPGQWAFAEAGWRVVAEPGGVVSVWIRGDDPLAADEFARERRWLAALAKGALWRQAVALGVAPDKVTTPDWLAVAAAEVVLTRGNPALLDEWRRASRCVGVLPGLRDTLLWTGAQGAKGIEAESRRLAAFGAWLWLQAEAGRSASWQRLVAGLLEGVSPGLALVRAYDSQFAGAEAREIELAWQVGAAAQAAMRAVPALSAAESRRRLEQADRLVLRPGTDGEEEARQISELWLQRGDPWLAATRGARLPWLTAQLAAMHPFYRNAAVSLGQAWLALENNDVRGWSEALPAWRRDLEQGRELERASTRLLDAVTGGR